MYKVYLSPTTSKKRFELNDCGAEEFRMNQIADVVEQYLLHTGEYAVYRNVCDMTNDEIIRDSNDVKPNIHIAIQSNYNNKPGINCYVKDGDKLSNGIGKEVYKQLVVIYNNKNIDNGLTYIQIKQVNAPAILIELGDFNNKQEVDWIINNTSSIGKAIAQGIEKGFALKLC